MLALTDVLATILGSLGGVAAVIAAVVGFLVHRDQLETAKSAQRVDLLHVGQESLKEALNRADAENKSLRDRLDQQEKKLLAQDIQILALNRHVDILEHELAKFKQDQGVENTSLRQGQNDTRT